MKKTFLSIAIFFIAINAFSADSKYHIDDKKVEHLFENSITTVASAEVVNSVTKFYDLKNYSVTFSQHLLSSKVISVSLYCCTGRSLCHPFRHRLL